MVKNTPSISSLHDAMNDVKVSPPSTQTRISSLGKPLQQMPQTPPESNVNLNQPTQLVGTDAYTKFLMNRIATATATTEEKEQWQQHVAAVKASPNPGADIRRWQFEQEKRRNMKNAIARLGPPPYPELQGQQLRDFQIRSIQARKRSELQTRIDGPVEPVSALPHTRQHYEMQLMLLEQESKDRLESARVEQESVMQPEILDSAQHDRAEQDRVPGECHAHNEVADAPQGVDFERSTRKNAARYTEPFCRFLTDNPTVFHAVGAVKKQLKDAGFTELSERDSWDLKEGGSYFVERNGSALIAFTVGANYEPGNGAAILAGHVDALTAKLKPISQVPNKAGYVQLGVAPYAGAPNNTWWDRDLGIGGRVLVKEGDKIVTKLVKLDWPIARIPTLAPHFGAAANGPFNPETQMTPIIGLDGTDSSPYEHAEPFNNPPLIHGAHDGANAFIQTQPPRLVKAIGNALDLRADTYSSMVNWELELFDTQPATVGGLDKEFIFAGRIDDKLCSWAAIQALVETKDAAENSSLLQVVGLFDDEEIGSGLRQGARSNFLPSVLERTVAAFTHSHGSPSDIMGRTYANSFLVSSDVIHAVNPNFLGAYLENHAPHLNVGIVVSADSNGHMTTDAVSTAILKRCADKVGAKLQVFQIRNDSRSGGTVGPMLSSMTGIRAVDAGIPQLSMHSIRATTGSLDPGLGVLMFKGFLGGFEEVDREFRE
ncbi:vacuolar aminopeptidase 1 [Friedmanniomyces endolithicus]|uniref:Vacuolar aminopeptidase 1 n=1 Tax=Friedmanniomyces endolithicus TaxID=329885 RepID=A0AAN6JLC2_9PEZI|nr:vacuolar aminopeptidase 1 [Friedmanniomyces endolithicus]KAK0289704.1 vacuolar aminopeptidase 1 [Friedmanniomyces endolithicus]KAK0328520.1 vacuolar aminopeptidase 1 [Friedmanniomyces endolithicus]KAK1019783.1 vacuolar aminopeptidase 1 [Friedmanniomyces endolithicus]